MKTNKITRIAALASIVVVSGALSAFGQNSNSGEIKGQVTDASGAVVPGASVTLLDTATGVSTKTQTNDVGIYDVPSLPTGPYSITFSKTGFRNEVRNGVVLQIGTIGALSALWTGVINAGVWTAGALAIHAIVIAGCRKFLGEPPGSVNIVAWRLRFIALDLCLGVTWMLDILHIVHNDGVAGTFVLFVMLLVVAVSSMLGSTIAAANTAFLLQSTAFIGSPPSPAPGQQGGGVWVRGVDGNVNIKSTSTGSATGTKECT